jgi:precorrin-2 dehydrogenase/sirohydrochlorin ferrochelatase
MPRLAQAIRGNPVTGPRCRQASRAFSFFREGPGDFSKRGGMRRERDGEPMALFPMFMKLAGKRALVVGAGRVGEPKIRSLLRAGAQVRVVAPHATPRVQAWAREGQIDWAARPFDPRDLQGATLAIVATASEEVNERISRLARRRRIPVNVVDDPERCDFYYPAVIRRGPLLVAISTEGRSPALARRLRQYLERIVTPELGRAVEQLGRERDRLLSQSVRPGQRRRALLRLAREVPLGR